MDGDKIIQIIPAPTGLKALFEGDEGKCIESPVVCIALKQSGEMVFMDTCGDGIIDEVSNGDNFLGLKW